MKEYRSVGLREIVLVFAQQLLRRGAKLKKVVLARQVGRLDGGYATLSVTTISGYTGGFVAVPGVIGSKCQVAT
jgi:hypothetical protein